MLGLVLKNSFLRQKAYKMTLAEDFALLEDLFVKGRRRMAIEVCPGEKKLLSMAALRVDETIADVCRSSRGRQYESRQEEKIVKCGLKAYQSRYLQLLIIRKAAAELRLLVLQTPASLILLVRLKHTALIHPTAHLTTHLCWAFPQPTSKSTHDPARQLPSI